ncbi:nuclear transport factor 2 family protein [Chitinophaga sp. ARDCPP14]|uniref:nuclear transport factor 2 family protein n=1 Tax=Chitinophaga sp. ARDCPP14 TaxID=3391139 RepID=UPI003F524705
MKKLFITATLILTCMLSFRSISIAQHNDQQLSAVILHNDSLFWRAYNSCDITKMMEYFSEDIEFYHDKGGITLGKPAMAQSFEKGVCGNKEQFTLRREAVDSTIKVFPLKKDGVIYGAILTGSHLFYIHNKGKKEYADGLAKFTDLWLLKNGSWKMTRALSYDHGPAPYVNKRKALTLPADVLRSYAGKYKGPQTTSEIKTENGLLIMLIGDKKFSLYAEKENLFFTKERDLTFEFIKKGNEVIKLIVRERDDVTEELQRDSQGTDGRPARAS